MKTEQKLEIYRELFGSLPDVPEGKELVGFERKLIEAGDLILTNKDHTIWHKVASVHGRLDRSSIVAIFQDTHRADGTPICIDPLPDDVMFEGYRVEYAGEAMQSLDGADAYITSSRRSEWDENFTTLEPNGCEGIFYARLFKIAQPTTLAQLVGEDGQKVVWLHTESEGAVSSLIDCRDGKIYYVDGKKLECLGN